MQNAKRFVYVIRKHIIQLHKKNIQLKKFSLGKCKLPFGLSDASCQTSNIFNPSHFIQLQKNFIFAYKHITELRDSGKTHTVDLNCLLPTYCRNDVINVQERIFSQRRILSRKKLPRRFPCSDHHPACFFRGPSIPLHPPSIVKIFLVRVIRDSRLVFCLTHVGSNMERPTPNES